MSRATFTDLARNSLSAEKIRKLSDPDIQTCLDRADAFLDSILAGRWTLPLLAPYPQDLISAGADIAAWYILKRSGFNPEGAQDKLVRQGYIDAVKWANDAAQYMIHPQIVGTIPTAQYPQVQCEASQKRGW